jgi:hypothetical protein
MNSRKKMVLLFSHKLTEMQIKEAEDKWQIKKFVYLPQDLQKIWSGIDPAGELDINRLNKICEWLTHVSDKGDYLLVQGDFGAVFYIVEYSFRSGRIPIYSTTHREADEIKIDGNRIKKTNLFEHIVFRKYRRYLA